MSTTFVRVGFQVINPSFVAAAKWENETLFIYLVGGRFTTFRGDQAKAIWRVFCDESVDVPTLLDEGRPGAAKPTGRS